MIKRNTQNDLLLYAYNETGLSDGDAIQRAIDGDPVVSEEYKEIVRILDVLDCATPEINPESIRRILEFC